MGSAGAVVPSGSLDLKVIRPVGPGGALTAVPMRHLSLREVAYYAAPRAGLPAEVNEWRERNWPRVLAQALRVNAAVALGRRLGVVTAYGRLSLAVIRRDGVYDYGIASFRVVTNAGVAFLTDALQNLVEPELLKYHGIGTGTAAESASDTALGSELTTQYSPDNTRATGSQTESASNIYRTVGTNTVDAAVAITEHGIFTQAATGGGTLLDRSVFAALNLGSGDSLQTTYDFTQNPGG